ncbi:MAG: GNAT family N-acetyltransferase [Proteobacteria bacterium]|nr:GNAT family N-acetyltransferase [Pseudomonadota bacterium]
MQSHLIVRSASQSDLEGLTILFDQYRQFYQCAPDLAAARNWLKENIEQERSAIFVADSGGTLLGFTQLYPALCSVDLVDYFVLYDLFVVEAARRQGIARALMNAASDWAKAQGAARLDLETARDNIPGQALYKDLGYELDEVFLKFSLDLTE